MTEAKIQIAVQLPVSLKYAVEARAKREHRSVAGFVRSRLAEICSQTEDANDVAVQK
jgi:hypothetical protein